MNTEHTESTGNEEFGKPKILRAWFDTVFHPCINGLNTEIKCLKEARVGWDTKKKKFDNILPAYRYVDLKYIPNLNQVMLLTRKFDELFQTQNESWEKMVEACMSLEKTIMESQLFSSVFEKYFVLNEDGRKTTEEYIGKNDVSLLKSIVCQHMINNDQKLPPHYTMSHLWNKISVEFFPIFGTSPINEYSKYFEESKNYHLASDIKLREELNHFMYTTSVKYDVPLVEKEPEQKFPTSGWQV